MLEEEVKKALKTIQPGIRADGGNLTFVKIDEHNVVWIKLSGACEDCPLSSITLKQGIERIVKMVVPEVSAVKTV